MADDLVGVRSEGSGSPDGVGWSDERRAGVVEATCQRAHGERGLVGPDVSRHRPVVGHLALDVAQDLASAGVDAEHARCAVEPGRLQVAEQRVHGRRPRPCLAPHRVADPHDGAEVPAWEQLLDHPERLSFPCRFAYCSPILKIRRPSGTAAAGKPFAECLPRCRRRDMPLPASRP